MFVCVFVKRTRGVCIRQKRNALRGKRRLQLTCSWQLGAPLRAPITLGANVTFDPFI